VKRRRGARAPTIGGEVTDAQGARAARLRLLEAAASAAFEELARGVEIAPDADVAILGRGLMALVMRIVCASFAHATGRLSEPPWREEEEGRDLVHRCAALGPSPALAAFVATGARIRDASARRAVAAIVATDEAGARSRDLEIEDLGAAYEALLGVRLVRADARGGSEERAFSIEAGEDRRRAGAHYTPRSVTARVVAQTLDPLLPGEVSAEAILAMRVCDPAMGSGAFLIEANRQLATRLLAAWTRASASGDQGEPLAAARLAVASRCLYGVDRDPIAVELARFSLWHATGATGAPFAFLEHALRCGDALVGHGGEASAATEALLGTLGAAPDRFDWGRELPEVFAEGRGGFDAIVGNPPWVSYAGRAAQPLDPDRRAFFAATSPAFRGYRNLQGVFVHRAATLLRPSGRLGLVVPTSMSDLAGYEPSRRAHDELCVCDGELRDLHSGGFEGVFQPCMALVSTRRPASISLGAAGPWPLERTDVDDEAAEILAALAALPRLPSHLFGERGFQTSGTDTERLRTLDQPEGPYRMALRTGSDVEPARRRPPRLYCDPDDLGRRLRPPEAWRDVKLLLRQTARYPMAALSDGLAFRNSVLAGFADEAHDAHMLLAYLNSAPVRWFHYMRHRDARQGMPQLKIGHLRALPAPHRGEATARLEELGRLVGERNTGTSPDEQARIDAAAADALGLSATARVRVAAWASATRG
jgi:hypothetical protein